MTMTVNTTDRKKMKSMIVEMTICLERIDSEKEAMKDIAEVAESQFGIKKKFINRMARTMFKHCYADLQSENNAFEYLYEAVIDGKGIEED